MDFITVTPRDRKVVAWLVLIAGALLTLGGLVGVWLQGQFYERGFPTAATFGEVRSAFTWPTAFTTSGSLIVAVVLLSSSMPAAWSARRRLVVFLCFAAFVLMAATVCGHLATSRVAKILN